MCKQYPHWNPHTSQFKHPFRLPLTREQSIYAYTHIQARMYPSIVRHTVGAFAYVTPSNVSLHSVSLARTVSPRKRTRQSGTDTSRGDVTHNTRGEEKRGTSVRRATRILWLLVVSRGAILFLTERCQRAERMAPDARSPLSERVRERSGKWKKKLMRKKWYKTKCERSAHARRGRADIGPRKTNKEKTAIDSRTLPLVSSSNKIRICRIFR